MAREDTSSTDYNVLGSITTMDTHKKNRMDSIASEIAQIFICGITWRCSGT